ncbi:hypothetical protein PYW07_003792 [Mythimna separata]|uniref:IML2 n=1 Tax=Mythimna separata TaxID=271217 RepID=A0A8F3HLN4_MYTSE|nr:hypothetical protein PYW07_003786 [Mythimna separata]KAJ8722612.1 hypothetical protein PYW07_003792 [Mythimna separata]QWY13099.1 IML2 [Mythimna separata]
MVSKVFLVILIVNLVTDCSYGQRDKKFFRKDYKYIDSVQGFYKIHTLHKTWFEAKRVCALEGASLFYPENDDEAQAVISYWNDTQPFSWVYVGISDLLVKGVFETINGNPVSDVYNYWAAGEPNDAGGVEDCVILKRDGTYNDFSCDRKTPFICKKSLLSLEWNQACNIPNLDYIYNEEVGRCYKFHLTPMSWTDAYSVCSAEQSYLTVINTQSEADYLVKLTELKTRNQAPGDYLSGAVHIGFHNRLNDGWQAVRGTTLDDTGYVCWGQNQPDGEGREQCGSMFYNGLLNDVSCDTRCFFICEHEVDTLETLYDDRFGDR